MRTFDLVVQGKDGIGLGGDECVVHSFALSSGGAISIVGAVEEDIRSIYQLAQQSKGLTQSPSWQRPALEPQRLVVRDYCTRRRAGEQTRG